MKKIAKNDTVKVISGNHKGKVGRVLKVYPKRNRIIVEKVALVKRHQKPRSQQDPGGIIEKEAAIHMSNVLIVCPKTGKVGRVGVQRLANGKNVRVHRVSGEMMDEAE